MNSIIDVKDGEEEDRFLIRPSNKEKIQKIVFLFYITIMAYILIQFLEVFPLQTSTKKMVFRIISNVSMALPCIKMAYTILMYKVWDSSSEDFRKLEILQCAKALVDLVLMMFVIQEWRSKKFQMTSEKTGSAILISYVLFLSQILSEDFESGSITAILSGGILTKTVTIIEEKQFQKFQSLLKIAIDFISRGIPDVSAKKDILKALEVVFPVFFISFFVMIIIGIFMKFEKKLLKNFKLPRKILTVACGLILFLLSFFVFEKGIDMAKELGQKPFLSSRFLSFRFR
ncbi:uncharacterized protein Eint_031220 [Encephalitozoon intestinalis ATCC 50506]|uniref:Uncharacterized protein n=1 Tax=Encephalitozoon intestinalis (strain ATCC 50506) TaxID=876142 RepID=E0S6C9_ENCIT|nr:uncharacterized protein Eint_031220 [Encephalitozoon intestinalis ATCC 50506]ADM11264.1 hypothetical protein Eint_031220 [Encephalitozoon intestinalis ATCC 50506]UTX44932.1 hypothetical protein GPK93_03g04610 [Encephalitozoon intestinalis]